MRRQKRPENPRLRALTEERDDLMVQLSLTAHLLDADVVEKLRRVREIDHEILQEWSRVRHG